MLAPQPRPATPGEAGAPACLTAAAGRLESPYAHHAEGLSMAAKLDRIAVLTSGGDCPGMNAGIRAGVRTALANGLSVTGIVDEATAKTLRTVVQRPGKVQ